MTWRSFFEPERLPNPADYYQKEFPELKSLPVEKAWIKVRCCFHDDSNPSLSLHLLSGGFYCFGCGARGGNVIDFVMRRYQLTFKQACQRLGAWR